MVVKQGGRYQTLSILVNKYGWTKGAELGVYRGDLFFHLLDNHPNLSMIGVDNWKEMGNPHARKQFTPEEMAEIGYEVVKKAKAYGTRALIWHMSTRMGAKMLNDEVLDFVFIDATHTYEAVKADIKDWFPKLKIGGWMTGHDISLPDVQKAVTEMFSHCAVIVYPGDVWAVIRGRE